MASVDSTPMLRSTSCTGPFCQPSGDQVGGDLVAARFCQGESASEQPRDTGDKGSQVTTDRRRQVSRTRASDVFVHAIGSDRCRAVSVDGQGESLSTSRTSRSRMPTTHCLPNLRAGACHESLRRRSGRLNQVGVDRRAYGGEGWPGTVLLQTSDRISWGLSETSHVADVCRLRQRSRLQPTGTGVEMLDRPHLGWSIQRISPPRWCCQPIPRSSPSTNSFTL